MAEKKQKFCPVCKTRKLSLKQINLETAVYLCRDRMCSYPVGFGWTLVPRTLQELLRAKKKRKRKVKPQMDMDLILEKACSASPSNPANPFEDLSFSLDNLINDEINKIQDNSILDLGDIDSIMGNFDWDKSLIDVNETIFDNINGDRLEGANLNETIFDSLVTNTNEVASQVGFNENTDSHIEGTNQVNLNETIFDNLVSDLGNSNNIEGTSQLHLNVSSFGNLGTDLVNSNNMEATSQVKLNQNVFGNMVTNDGSSHLQGDNQVDSNESIFGNLVTNVNSNKMEDASQVNLNNSSFGNLLKGNNLEERNSGDSQVLDSSRSMDFKDEMNIVEKSVRQLVVNSMNTGVSTNASSAVILNQLIINSNS